MALLVKDRIKETTSTTGTGTLTLAGAVAGYQAFSVLGNGATTYYALTDANGTAWEVGLGTYTTSGTTLAMDIIERALEHKGVKEYIFDTIDEVCWNDGVKQKRS